MPQNFYELAWIFIIYAFLGWCTEVSYAALDRGIFVNRGFLNGPYCPIYGCGVVIVITILSPLQDNLLLLFLGSFFLTSVLEYVTGFVLEKVFHDRWWDYSHKPFNLRGYVCLKFSVYWGLACTFIIKVIHPIIYRGITWIPHVFGVVLVVIFMTVFIVDSCITVSTILKFNKRLKLMDEMAEKIHKLSDEIGENIYENVTGVIQKSEEFQENHADLLDKLAYKKEDILELPQAAKEKLTETTGEWKKGLEQRKKELAELSDKYEKLFEEKNFGFRRLMKAFPDMKSRDNNRMLEAFRNHFRLDKEEKEGKL